MNNEKDDEAVVRVRPSVECSGLGVFCARESRGIAPLTFLAAYPGVRIPVTQKDPDRLISVKKLQYLATGHDGSYVIDPTNDDGSVCDEYSKEIGVRFNEPPMDKVPTAAFVSNYKTQRLEIWSIANIEPNQEVSTSSDSNSLLLSSSNSELTPRLPFITSLERSSCTTDTATRETTPSHSSAQMSETSA